MKAEKDDNWILDFRFRVTKLRFEKRDIEFRFLYFK